MNWPQVYLFISLITISNKLLLFLLFFFQRNNKEFNRLFAFIIGSAIPLMVSNLLNYLQKAEYISLIFVGTACSMLYYPLCIMFLYETLKIPLKKGWKFQLYMWVPVSYNLLLMLGYIFFWDATAKQHYIEDIFSYRWESGLALANLLPLYFYFLAHSIYFIFFIRKANSLTRQFAKDHIIRRRYRFVRTFVGLLIGLSIFLFATSLFDFSNEFIDMIIVPISSNIITLLIVFFAFDGRLVREEDPDFQLVEKRAGSAILNPSKEVMPKGRRKALKQEIDTFFDNNEAFYASDFSLQKMAELLSASVHQLSFVINAEHGQSFSDLLGQHRIKRAKIMIESDDYKHLSLEGIGQLVGYKSKSTFFAHFKKNTGKTPLDFKRSIINSNVS